MLLDHLQWVNKNAYAHRFKTDGKRRYITNFTLFDYEGDNNYILTLQLCALGVDSIWYMASHYPIV